jgi:hypothetical protein
MLIFRTISGGEADLAQRVFETRLLRGECELLVVLETPVRALLDRADAKPPLTLGTQ